jgi:hypothetical protein
MLEASSLRKSRSQNDQDEPTKIPHSGGKTHTPDSIALAPSGRCAISAESAVSLRYPSSLLRFSTRAEQEDLLFC